MKLSWNVIAQIIGTLVSASTALSGFLPPKSSGMVITTISALQGVFAVISHHYNTNGTPQEVPGGAAAQ